MTEMPEKLEEKLGEHQDKYKEGVWSVYSFNELGWWVHLFAERSQHRATAEKAQKDLTDARNYLAIMETMLDELEEEVMGQF